MCDGSAKKFAPIGKHHTQQGRKQSQEFVVVGQSRAALQAAENLAKKLLQLQEADTERKMFTYLNHLISETFFQTRHPPSSEAVRRTWAAHCLLVCRAGRGAEPEKPAPPGQHWPGRGW